MYEGLRLTELHEERANARERAARYKNLDRAYSQIGAEMEAESYAAEIRARVAAQEIGKPYLYRSPGVFCGYQFPLLFGVPDAERLYSARRQGTIRTGKPYDALPGETYWSPEAMEIARALAGVNDWTNHARHAIPVEGCHLCREGRR